MVQTFKVKGFFGGYNVATILVLELRDGSSWYCIEGSEAAFQTWDIIQEGIHVDKIADFDSMQQDLPIFTLDDLTEAVDEYSKMSIL